MAIGRSDASVVLIQENLILAGGCVEQICPGGSSCFCNNVTATVESYLPLTDTWIQLPSMPSPRYRHAAVAIGNKMYVVGGRDVSDTLQQEVFVFDFDTKTWTTLAQLWTAASSDLVAVSVGTFLYAISGYSETYESLNTTCVLDTRFSGSWQCQKQSLMNHGRGDACGAVMEGLIYVFGGFSDKDWCSALDHVEVFNPVLNKWEDSTPLHKPRGDAACAVLHNEFHAIGGEKKDVTCTYDVPIQDVEHYDLSTNSWIEEEPLADARFRFVGASFGDAIYVFGGQGFFDNVTQTQPVLNSVMKWVDETDEVSSASTVGMIFGVLFLGLLL